MSPETEALAKAHQRIAELEAMLRAPGPPKSREPSYAWLALVGIVGAFIAAYLPEPKPQRDEVVTWIPAPEVVDPGTLGLANDDAPSFWKNEDRSYAFVLGRRRGAADLAVAAFDRRDWSVAWRSEPVAGEGRIRGHIVALKGAVAFAGAKEIIAFDAATGTRKLSTKLDRPPAYRIFVDPDEPEVAFAGHALSTTNDEQEGLDVVTGEAKRRRGGGKRDFKPVLVEISPEIRAALPDASQGWTLQDGKDEITIVRTRVGAGPGSLEHAVALDGKSVKWHARLAPKREWKPWPNTVPDGKAALANRRVLYSYAMPDGQRRITAIALDDGHVLYDEPIGGVGHGSVLGEFGADGDEAFLVANQSLIVFDARDGRVKKRIIEF